MFDLWLDNVRMPSKDFWESADGRSIIVCRNVYQARQACLNNKGQIVRMSLDHDLGNGPNGYDFVVWLTVNCLFPVRPPIVHSMNPVGRKRMELAIERYYGNR